MSETKTAEQQLAELFKIVDDYWLENELGHILDLKLAVENLIETNRVLSADQVDSQPEGMQLEAMQLPDLLKVVLPMVEQAKAHVWVRTCQSCGKRAQYTEPNMADKKERWRDIKCKACGSVDLDYGSKATL